MADLVKYLNHDQILHAIDSTAAYPNAETVKILLPLCNPQNDPKNVLDNAVYYSAYYGSKENIVVFFGVVLLENAWLELRQEYPDDRTYNWFDDEVARDPLRLRKNLTNTTTDVKSPSFVKKCRVYKSIPYN